MTSSTSASKAPSPLKTALVYLIASLFCAFFGAVYEIFSHGVYSYFMIYAFAIPLGLGALPNLVVSLAGRRAPGKRAANAWNSGVAALTVGSIFQGALEIYGTTSQLALVYPIVAAILLAAGAVFHVQAASRGAGDKLGFMQRAFRTDTNQACTRNNRPGISSISHTADIPGESGVSSKAGALSPCVPRTPGEASGL